MDVIRLAGGPYRVRHVCIQYGGEGWSLKRRAGESEGLPKTAGMMSHDEKMIGSRVYDLNLS